MAEDERALKMHVGIAFYGTPAYDKKVYADTEKVLQELSKTEGGDFRLVTWVDKTGTAKSKIYGEDIDIRKTLEDLSVKKVYISKVKYDPKAETASDRFSLDGTVELAIAKNKLVMTDKDSIKAHFAFQELKFNSKEFVNFAIYAVDGINYTDKVKGDKVDYYVAKAKEGTGLFIAPIIQKDSGGAPLKLLDVNGKENTMKSLENEMYDKGAIYSFDRNNLQIKKLEIKEKMKL
jgi:hypothetical protein